MKRKVGVVTAVLCAIALVSAGCTSSTRDARRSRRDVVVFAAASLTEAFGDLRGDLARRGLNVRFDFGGSQSLARQIEQGAPADVFASADEKTMGELVAKHLVEPPAVFAENRLEIAVAPGNPRHVRTLADLARKDLTVVLADPSVPVGGYARAVLARAGITVTPVSLELDVKAALAKVTSGEADATIVYASDVEAAGAKAGGVQIPAAQNAVARYPIAVVRSTKHAAAARAFIDDVRGQLGQRALRSRGFVPRSE